MNPDNDAELQARVQAAMTVLADGAPDEPSKLPDRSSVARHASFRGQRSFAVAAAVLFVAVGGLGWFASRWAGDGDVVAAIADPSGLWIDLAPDSVSVLPDAPIEGRSGPSAVWTGSEMVVWGGAAFNGSENPLSDGAAFDPATGSWRMLPEAPIEGRAHAATTWTGTEMIVWGGSQDGQLVGDGAAFDPAANTWRVLSDSPLPPAMLSAVAWTGTEVIIIGGLNDNNGKAAAYDPFADTWRDMPDAPGPNSVPFPSAVWTGEAVLTVLSANGPGGENQLAMYWPEVDEWQIVQDSFIPETVIGVPGADLGMVGNESIGLAVFADTDLPVLDPLGGTGDRIESKPESLPSPELFAPVWSGQEILMWSGGEEGLALDPATRQWRSFPGGGLAPRTHSAVVWADGFLIAWGGFVSEQGGTAFTADDGIIYRPPGGGPTETQLRIDSETGAVQSGSGEAERCKTLYGDEPWITLFDTAQAVPCVLVAEFQNLQIWNKGFDTLTVEWVEGKEVLQSDSSFETGPIGDVVAGPTIEVESSPYPMPVIHVMAPEQSPSRNLRISNSAIGDAQVGMTLADATVILGLEISVDPNGSPGPRCWVAVIANDPYSPIFVVSGDGSDQSRITSIVRTGDDDPAEPTICES